MTQSLDSPSALGRFFPIAKALAAEGNHVTVFTLHHDYANCAQRRFVQDGVHVHYLGQMHVHKVGDTKIYFSPTKLIRLVLWATLRLSWAALREPADRVHLCKPQPMNGIAAWLTHKLRGTPILLDSDDFEAMHNQFGGGWQQRIVAWFENWAASFATRIVAGNQFVAGHYRSLGYPTEKLSIVYNGVERGRFSAEHPPLTTPFPSEKSIVYVGSMRLHSHAVDLLLEAFAHVLEAEPAARLLLFGGGPDLQAIRELADSMSLTEFVYFSGRIGSKQVPAAYRAGIISADPRRNNAAAASSFSLKMVESIAAGVPCVTTDIGDRKAQLGAAGMAVSPDDTNALANALLHFLNNGDMLAEAQAACHKQRDTLLWDQKVAAYHDNSST